MGWLVKKCLILLFISYASGVFAQKHAQARVDSLIAKLPKVNDTDRLTIYVQLMGTYDAFDREAALQLAKPAMNLAEKLNSAVGIGDVKGAIGRIYWRERNFELALKNHTEAKQIFEKAGDNARIAQSLRFLGQDYADNGNYPEALNYFGEAMALYKTLGDKKNMAYLHELFAFVYEKQGDYLRASQSSYAELSLFEEIGDGNNAATAAEAVAVLFVELGNLKEALKMFRRSERVYKETSDQINVGYSHLHIGRVHRLMAKYTESVKDYDSALHTSLKIHDVTIEAMAYQGYADIAFSKGDHAQALVRYLKAADAFVKAVNKRELARVYCSIGECYRREGNFDRAREYYNDAGLLAREIKSKTLLTEYFRGVEKLDSTTGNWNGAYFNYKEFIAHRDSVFNQENISKMVQLQLEHNFEKKEAASLVAQNEKDLRQKRQSVFLGIIALLVLVLVGVLWRNQARVAKINRELALKTQSLEEENREKTSILKIVSHDLRSPFNKIKGLVNLLKMDQDISDEERKQYFSFIDASINQGNYLIKHLLDAQTNTHATDIPSFQTIDIERFVNDFKQVIQRQLDGKQQLLHTSVTTKNKIMLTDPQILTRVLDNLISNASKFSESGKSIYLVIKPVENFLRFSVADEGPGISEEDQKLLFRRFQKLSAEPTAGENSTGLGLSITKALVEKLNGTIRVNSKKGSGTEMIVMIPNA